MEGEKKRGWWTLVVVALVLAALPAGGYVGAYYAMVRTWALPSVGLAGVTYGPPHVAYPAEWMCSFFEPMHQIDRKWIRPKFWTAPFIP